ncbi:hypothetical protein CORC01_08362 [Colletotrichum orchidophilum]|uniref:Uncharacterized protein n=1 Tax=Colletotrichum orchidophilum TaxID=1209926 RepID=A0A1G4B4D3_9PEZI|nr:uncharacterized protein CORC01_08362 [Colletotrichum orchidophilum]OHE96290.1 hypothetical protein CORC01_08362 [Colletotrichum orchidophilum]
MVQLKAWQKLFSERRKAYEALAVGKEHNMAKMNETISTLHDMTRQVFGRKLEFLTVHRPGARYFCVAWKSDVEPSYAALVVHSAPVVNAEYEKVKELVGFNSVDVLRYNDDSEEEDERPYRSDPEYLIDDSG